MATLPTSGFPGSGARLGFYVLIASLPFSDFLQTGIVAFNAAPVMGDLGASPEEYSIIATLYAVVAIGVIAGHRELVERLGWRRVLLGSSALFGLGSLLCAASGTLGAFALGRVLMALGCGSFMTAGRVLVNHIPPSPRRFTGIKFFAAGLAWGAVAGPVLASTALAARTWRAGFAALVLPALLVALLAALVLDDGRPVRLASTARTPGLPIALLSLMGGSFVLLHALAQSGFDHFDHPAALWGGLAMGAAVLGLFVASGSRAATALIGFRPLTQWRYLVGLGVFTVCYLVLGANNLMLPVLLQRALGLPLEIAGRYLGMGALAGVASWIVLSRLLPRHPAPARYYLAGFGALAACGWQLSHLSEGANPFESALPALMCNGAFIILALATTAMQTFQTVQQDERVFSHANQVKNMLAQFGVAAGMALATLCMQWRSSVRFTHLSESLSPSNTAFQEMLDRLTRHFAATADPVAAPRMALAQLAQMVSQEATLMAVLDYFSVITVLALACLTLVAVATTWQWKSHA
ncbi:MFS transporter [Variovorax sp. PAMC 28711]|uniref:MFS transporter n=1 Tax=Variovorax sp. PAMC 28711 TaxID=1795631 RepID=UPI00078C1B31|nr:MFS transporter [Variovorax sp. PAMC 28711]AMM26381.1 hypothetical protein AX767_20030 [Variovorax sp. PAMC 28711]